MWRLLQRLNFPIELAHSRQAVLRMALRQVVADVLHVLRGGRSPADAHFLGTKHFLKAGVHLIFLDELAAVDEGLGFQNGSTEAGVFGELQRGCPHQIFSDRSGGSGGLNDLRFLFGREMDFHAFQDTGKTAEQQQGRRPLHKFTVP